MHVPHLIRIASLAALAVAVVVPTFAAVPASAAQPSGAAATLVLADPKGGVFALSGSPWTGWGLWSSVSEGSTTPGAPVTAVVTGPDDDDVTLFLADPLGGVFTVSGSPSTGWGLWSSVSEGSTTPGAPVTAVVTGPDDDDVTLFLADPLGGVFTVSGSPSTGWGLWSSVSEGSTTPGAPVTAVVTGPHDDDVTLFLADPLGGVFTVSGSPSTGWGLWSSVKGGSTTPGAPVTAVVNGDDEVMLFVTDPEGWVHTTSGSPGSGWGPWSSVWNPRTTPGAPVTAVVNGDDEVMLFVTDLEGWVHTTSGSPGSGWGGWSSVPGGRTTPGAPVTSVVTENWVYAEDRDRDGDIDTFLFEVWVTLFVANPDGEVITASNRKTYTPYGSQWSGWGSWSSVSQGSTSPGATVTAVASA